MSYKANYKLIDWSVKAPERPKPTPPESKRGDFCAPMVVSDYQTYDCPITGNPIEGRAAHKENLKRNNCRLLEKGESREAPKRYEERQAATIDNILNGAE